MQETRRRAFAERGYVLRDINFDVQPGQVIGLLGATGSGKSSLVNLLPRFYDYSGGNITLDGEELRAYARGFLRSQIGIVQQEPFLFSTTIRNNITYGLGRDVSEEEMEAAARAAAIHDVVQTFPKGYDTLVGERGVTLSGGQKQRVTIARTLLKDPAILLLDDATSSVDTATDATIRAALSRLMQGRTTFIIAHRVQSVMTADQILVMEAGRIYPAGQSQRTGLPAGRLPPSIRTAGPDRGRSGTGNRRGRRSGRGKAGKDLRKGRALRTRTARHLNLKSPTLFQRVDRCQNTNSSRKKNLIPSSTARPLLASFARAWCTGRSCSAICFRWF